MLSVRTAVDEYIESVTDERQPDGKYHPSGMFLCDRQAIYQVRGYTPSDPVDLKSKRKFYVGHRIHEVVQRAMESARGVLGFYPEFEIDVPQHNLAGHGDGLILLDDGTCVVLEIKSISPFSAKKGLPQEHHVDQVRSYAWAAKHHGIKVYNPAEDAWETFSALGDAVTGVLLVYLDKDQLEIWEYFLNYADDWDDKVMDKLYELDAYREDEDSWPSRLPLKKDGKKQWPCNYCPFKTRCWKIDPSYVAPKEPF